MKLALVHDFLCGVGGSERVFQYLCEEFEEADIFTLAFRSERTLPYFSKKKIQTTWLNPFIPNSEAFRWSFPLATHVMQALDLSGYDVVLTSSATTAKYVKTRKGRQICYCYIPTRALWHTDEYFGKSWKRHLINPFLTYLKKRDFQNAKAIGKLIAISKASKDYIRKYYERDADVVFCPIETDKFIPSRIKNDSYLLVSRLEKWKKVEYAIEAFNSMGKNLRVIGKGAEEERLRKMAKSNIVFLGAVDDSALAREYRECKAVVFTPYIEYGLIPLEASASGTPVICYGRGGVEETMVPLGCESGKIPTAVFFYEQTAKSLIAAVEQFERAFFDPDSLVLHASYWNVEAFKRKMRGAVEDFAREFSIS